MGTQKREEKDTFTKIHQKLKTASIIFQCLKIIINSITKGEQPILPQIPTDDIGHLVQKAWQEQEKIGWSNIMKGRLSKKWGQAQQNFYSSNPTTSTKRVSPDFFGQQE